MMFVNKSQNFGGFFEYMYKVKINVLIKEMMRGVGYGYTIYRSCC